MPKTFTDFTRHALNGPTMGTRWSAVFHMPQDFDSTPVTAAMAAAVAEVDGQMSTWKADSDLIRLNAAQAGTWVDLPERLMTVLTCGLEVGRTSGGAFDIGVGDAVAAWGFGADAADPSRIRAALSASRRPAHDVLELDPAQRCARKHSPLALDLSGIAKGYAVDRLAEVARGFGIPGTLVGIDGELRAFGLKPDGSPWTVAVERPDLVNRAPLSILALHDAAIATSGDYRRWVEVGGWRFSHTMDPRLGRPLAASPASVTVVTETCMAADAWATALIVVGSLEGADMARRIGLQALFLDRIEEGFWSTSVGRLFEPAVSTPSRVNDGQTSVAFPPFDGRPGRCGKSAPNRQHGGVDVESDHTVLHPHYRHHVSRDAASACGQVENPLSRLGSSTVEEDAGERAGDAAAEVALVDLGGGAEHHVD
jgi:thiamine biosynthesis lipoprotein